MSNLIGGRVREVEKFHTHQYCIYKDNEFLCFEKDLIRSNSDPNKFYVIFDFLEDNENGEKIYHYKQLFLNILYNFNVAIDNILLVNIAPLPKMLKLLFSRSLTLESRDKTEVIYQINTFLTDHIGKTISEENLTNCSVIIDISARGTIRLTNPNDLVNFAGDKSQENFLNCEELNKMLDFVYKSNEVRDVTFILNSCYSSFKFGGLYLNWLRSKDMYRPNTNVFYSKPLLIYVYILILFLETNPKNMDCLTDLGCLKYVKENLFNIGLDHSTHLVDQFKLICHEHEDSFTNLIDLQQSHPFEDDRSDQNVFSNNVLLVFDDINNTASYLLFHSYLEGPFKQLDILKNLRQSFEEFNEILSKFYLELIGNYLLSTAREKTNDSAVESLSLRHFKFASSEKDIAYVLELVKRSFSDLPNAFLTNVTRKGTRYEGDAITLDQLF